MTNPQTWHHIREKHSSNIKSSCRKGNFNILSGQECVIQEEGKEQHNFKLASLCPLSFLYFFPPHLTHTYTHTLLTLLFIISLHAGRAICHPVTHLHTHVNTCVSICGNFLYRRFCKSFGVIENIFLSVMPNSNINKYPK